MKTLIIAALLAAAPMTAFAANDLPEFGNDGANICAEHDRARTWMNAAWENRGEFDMGNVTYTGWTEHGSTRVMITYEAYVKTANGRIVPMLCQYEKVD
jgi:hypothetical protein